MEGGKRKSEVARGRERGNGGGEVSIVLLRPRGLGALPPSSSLSSLLAPLRSRSPIIIIFYHNICFSHILFYVNGRSLPLPAPSTPVSSPFHNPHSTPDGRRFVCMASGNF